ncbi:zinc-binding dehydrogenase [Nocardioides sp. JQ2195]|nr:zinc-binding dehydrogenase [Nocardioides sp. JQ2195]
MWAQQLVRPREFVEVATTRPDADDLVDGEVLLRLRAGAICGSDLPVFNGLLTLKQRDEPGVENPPGSPMHEVVGEVIATRDPRHAVGDQVVGWGSRLNALSELTISLGDALNSFDPRLSPERAVMLQPLACVLHAVEQIPGVAGARAAVLGQGPMGLLFNHALRSAGARSVIGVDRLDRRDLGARMGADDVAHLHTSRWVGQLSDADRPEVVVEAIGHNVSTLDHALEAAERGGRIFYFGIPDDAYYPVNMQRLLRKNLSLMSGVTLQRRVMLEKASRYLAAHPDLVEAFVTHTFDVDQAQQGFELATAPTPQTAKITLKVAS